MQNYNEQSLKTRIMQYDHRARVLRQIQSDKLEKARSRNNILNYATVFISALVAFLTFFGVKNIHKLFLSQFIDLETLDFLFSFITLALLIAAFLQITLRLGEVALEHLNSVRSLTIFLTYVDDLKVMSMISPEQCTIYIEKLNSKYEVINTSLPGNSDKEWAKAKSKLEKKSS